MKQVLLIDMDSKIPNLALMKLSAWHKSKGNKVGFDIQNPELVHISCIFKENAAQAKGIASFFPHATIDIGGSGFDLKKELLPEIEAMKPDYDLYWKPHPLGWGALNSPLDIFPGIHFKRVSPVM